MKLGTFCLIFGIGNLAMAAFPPMEWQIWHVIIGAACMACFFHSRAF